MKILRAILSFIIVFVTICVSGFVVSVDISTQKQLTLEATKRPTGPEYTPLIKKHAIHITKGTEKIRQIGSEDGYRIVELYMNLKGGPTNADIIISIEGLVEILEADGRIKLKTDDLYHRFTEDGVYYEDEENPRVWSEVSNNITSYYGDGAIQDEYCWIYLKYKIENYIEIFVPTEKDLAQDKSNPNNPQYLQERRKKHEEYLKWKRKREEWKAWKAWKDAQDAESKTNSDTNSPTNEDKNER